MCKFEKQNGSWVSALQHVFVIQVDIKNANLPEDYADKSRE